MTIQMTIQMDKLITHLMIKLAKRKNQWNNKSFSGFEDKVETVIDRENDKTTIEIGVEQ